MIKGIVSGAEKDITRIPMLVRGVYEEGWEVRDNQDRLIWGREDEFQTATGTLSFKGYGVPLTSATDSRPERRHLMRRSSRNFVASWSEQTGQSRSPAPDR